MGKNCIVGQQHLKACDTCGMLLEECCCPECMVCGQVGNLTCLTIHKYGKQIELEMSGILRSMVEGEVPR